MPNKFAQYLKNKWVAVVGFLTMAGVVYGVLQGVFALSRYYHDLENFKKQVETIETTLIKIINEDKSKDAKISKLEDYVLEKKKSYAVGFRVFKEHDDITDKTTLRKMYRDWSGTWHEVHYDHDYSYIYGVDYFYYIDKETGDKIYCW